MSFFILAPGPGHPALHAKHYPDHIGVGNGNYFNLRKYTECSRHLIFLTRRMSKSVIDLLPLQLLNGIIGV